MKLFDKIKDGYAYAKSCVPPLKEVLSEDGVGSYSRVVGFIIVVSTLAWVTFLVVRTGALPELHGAADFIGISAGSTYAINQAKRVAAAAKSGIASANTMMPDAISSTPSVPDTGQPGGQSAG